MNIYEKALFVVRNMEIYKGEGRTAIKALERAKKVEELLGLYRKRFSFYNFDEDKQLREIKTLEKELEEMK